MIHVFAAFVTFWFGSIILSQLVFNKHSNYYVLVIVRTKQTTYISSSSSGLAVNASLPASTLRQFCQRPTEREVKRLHCSLREAWLWASFVMSQ